MYLLVNNNREFSSGAGVGLFIKTEHSFKIRDDLKQHIIENVWIETQNLIVAIIYKPPSLSNREFLDKFEETLQTICLSNKKGLIMGDHNFNTLKPTNISKEYVYIIDQARGQDGWILAEFSFCVFMDRDEVEVHKNAKRERGQYLSI